VSGIRTGHSQKLTLGGRAITEYIKAKYVEGKWLSAEHRASFGLAPQ
jgi:hypothetical protein